MHFKQLSGEVYYPSQEVIEKAHIKNWDETDNLQKRLYWFWEKMANELNWISKVG